MPFIFDKGVLLIWVGVGTELFVAGSKLIFIGGVLGKLGLTSFGGFIKAFGILFGAGVVIGVGAGLGIDIGVLWP